MEEQAKLDEGFQLAAASVPSSALALASDSAG